MSNEPSKNALYIAECILAADLNARGIASHIDAFAAREIERRREAEAQLAVALERTRTPEIEDFIFGIRLETAHQRERWGEAHDRSKSAENWYWLVGYLAGKALRSSIDGDRDKARHHTISSAAALFQWHQAISADATNRGLGDDADLAPVDRQGGSPDA